MGALITVSDLEVRDGVARVEDLRLAKALGFSDLHMIRTLIKRHIEALQQFGAVSVMQRKPGAKGGRPSTVFYLNEEQSLFITAKSDTPRAAEVTVEMVRVFRAYLREQEEPGPTGVVPARRRPAPGFGTLTAPDDRLYPFIERGDELIVEFCTDTRFDITEPSALYVLRHPQDGHPEVHWLSRPGVGRLTQPDTGMRYSKAIGSGMSADLVMKHWPVLGKVIGINKPTTAEKRQMSRCA